LGFQGGVEGGRPYTYRTKPKLNVPVRRNWGRGLKRVTKGGGKGRPRTGKFCELGQ